MIGLLLALVVAGSDPGVLRVGTDVAAPAQVDHRPPRYPEIARAATPQPAGVVVLEIGLDEKGRCVEIRVVRSAGFLDNAAIEAARGWRYAPTVVDGVPRRVVLTERVEVFPDEDRAIGFFIQVLKDRRQPPADRVQAIGRLEGVGGKKARDVRKALEKVSREEGDEAVRSAATAALARLGATP